MAITGEFTAHLEALNSAIGVLRKEHSNISTALGNIETKLKSVSSYWDSPAFGSYDAVHTWFTKASTNTLNLIKEMADRMQKTYDNYVAAEGANYYNNT